MDDLSAVLFDLDHTLCVSDQDGEALLDRAFERTGLGEPFAPKDVEAVDPVELPTAESSREFFSLVFGAAAERANGDVADADVRAVAEAYVELREPGAVSFRPGAREPLSVASDRYAVGLVTNGGRETQAAKLETLGIRDAFDAEVYCDPAAGIEPKPDPTPIELAVDELGVDPGASVLVGDDLSADVAGAHNAGARSAWVPLDPPALDPHLEPDHVLEGMAEFAALLKG